MKTIGDSIDTFTAQSQEWAGNFANKAREAEAAWQTDYGTVGSRKKFWDDNLKDL